jgi:rhodanese-related sulfurtransferase
MGDVVERVDEFPLTGEVLLICRTGNRSARAAEWLRRQGVDAVNVGGGIVAWIEDGQPVVAGDEPGA